jgi:pentose-5-phosphate-3-epimerase
MSIPVVPAVIPKSESHIVEMTKLLAFSHEFHLDVVDGKFVETTSWPYNPLGEPSTIKRHTDRFTLEVDLMVAEPLKAAKDWESAGADMLVFHLETIDLVAFIDFTAHTSISVGISFHGNSSLDTLYSYLPYADYVQVMGIYTIGKQGEPFDPVTLDKIRAIHEAFPNLSISVDGSVNNETIPQLVGAGVDRLIIGSAIVSKEDPHEAYLSLLRCVEDSL